MKIQTIRGEECKSTRPLWEEVFSEDSKEFLDYYYTYKAAEGIGYVLGEFPYDAMMFRNPYELMIGKQKREISYLVAVATRKEQRHKGYMTALLMESFQQMYREKNPFTFLMPANPAIYEPFDFSYVYEREVWKLSKEWIPALEGLWNPKKEREKRSDKSLEEMFLQAASYEEQGESDAKSWKEVGDDLLKQWQKKTGYELLSMRNETGERNDSSVWKDISEFSRQWLKERYEIYTVREEAYYIRQLKELISQKGDIFVAVKEGNIGGIFLYAREAEEVSIQEVMEQEEGIFSFLQKEEQKKPIIMARIIHVEEMLKLVKSRERKSCLIEVEDLLLPQNDGVYRVEMTPLGSTVVKLERRREAEKFYQIKGLAPQVLKNIFLNEIV